MINYFSGYIFYIYICLVLLILCMLTKIIFIDLKNIVKINKNLETKYKPFERKDNANWSILEIYLCGILLFPLRICLLFYAFCSLAIVIKLMSIYPFKKFSCSQKIIKKYT